jgi:ubiquinone/menaquinone biosynthesis C-methylase UbiE
MQISEYRNIFENEESHFYYQAINGLVLSLLDREEVKKGDKVLDAGCGTGGLLLKMSKNYDVQGIDVSSEAIKFCEKRKVRAKIGSLEKLPFKSDSFEAVTSVDVIYHKFIKDDSRALSELVRVLKPGGVLILRAPAFNFLKNDHDKVVMTNKRYTGKEFNNLAKKVKLKVIQISYLNPSLFLGSLLTKNSRGSSVKKIHPVINAV